MILPNEVSNSWGPESRALVPRTYGDGTWRVAVEWVQSCSPHAKKRSGDWLHNNMNVVNSNELYI